MRPNKRSLKTLVFCYQNCSDLLWQKIVLEIEKNFWNSRLKPRICKIFEITRTIYSNSERSEQCLETECFLTCSWRFLISNKLEQFKFKLEKIIGIKKHAGKFRKRNFFLDIFVNDCPKTSHWDLEEKKR